MVCEYESPNSLLSRNSDWSHTGGSSRGRCGSPTVREDGGFEAATPPSLGVHKVFSSEIVDDSKSDDLVCVCFTHVDCYEASTLYSDDRFVWPASTMFQVACVF